VVVENHLSQAGEINGLIPQMEGRMVRTERYKYCVFSRGNQRESLVDLQVDPDETTDLATDPKFRDILLQHRALLRRFGAEHKDALVAELLADNVKAIPFKADTSSPPTSQPKKRKQQ
jgi:arylsulfatase A-like enzyme